MTKSFPGKALFFSLILLGAAGNGLTARAAEEAARYTMSPTDDGFLRLDQMTGAVSHCKKVGSGWACEAVADDRRALQSEIDALQSENQQLKDELAAARAELPTDEEMEKTFTFFEGFIQRFAKAARLFKEEMAGVDEAAPEADPAP